MAVVEEDPIASSVANGVTTSFPFSFSLRSAADLVVTGTLDGIVTTYSLGVHYTVSGVGGGSGSADFLSAPASGTIITRYRRTQLVRSTDYQDNGDLPADTLNADFDRLWQAVQELEGGGRSPANTVRASAGEQLNELAPASARAGRLLAFNPATGQPQPSALTEAALAALAAASTVSGVGGGYTMYRSGPIATTAGQTVFSVGTTYVPNVNALMVSVNGAVLPKADYVESSDTTVTFVSPMTGAEEVEFFVGRFVSAPGEASEMRQVWIETYGADATGLVSSTDAILRAIAEVSFTGGTVLAGPGVFSLSTAVQVPPNVNIVGAGLGATVFRSSAAAGRIEFVRGSNDGRGGESGGFSINGNAVGVDLLKLGVVVERNFRGINLYNAAGGSGLLIDGAQNCNFYGVHSQNNAGANITLDYGAGNNRFFGCEFSRAGTWGVRFLQSGASPSGAFTAGPTSNRFIGCILERAGWAAGAPASADTANGLVYHGAGRFNSFVSMDLSLDALTSTNKPLVLIEKAGSFDSLLLNFHDCNWSGTAARTTAIEARANTSVHLSGRQTFENHLACFAIADTARIFGSFYPTTGGVTSYFVNQGGGSQPQQNLIVNEMRGRMSLVSPAGFVAQSYRADGASFAGMEVWPDRVLMGDGVTAADRRVAPVLRHLIPGVELNNGASQMVLKVGAVDLLVLTGAPTQSAPNGSIAINTAGGSGSTLYVRESGAWVAK